MFKWLVRRKNLRTLDAIGTLLDTHDINRVTVEGGKVIIVVNDNYYSIYKFELNECYTTELTMLLKRKG